MKNRLFGLALASVLMLPAGAFCADPIALPKDAKEALAKYDFSTPQAALKSTWKMEAEFDIVAMLAYERITRGPKAKLRLDSLEVTKEVDYEGKKILFVKYKDSSDDGKVTERKDVITMAKDGDSGLFVRRYVGSYEISQKNKELAEEMDKWTRRAEDKTFKTEATKPTPAETKKFEPKDAPKKP